jgi:hypothetical protein
MARMKSTLV